MRIVCLAPEIIPIINDLGAIDRVVGGVYYGGRWEFKRVGTYIKCDKEEIRALKPDIIFTSTYLQSQMAKELASEGFNVVHFNPLSLSDIPLTVKTVGEIIGRIREAEVIINNWYDTLEEIRSMSADVGGVRVYFEEWDDPPISCVRWVSEGIELAGGIDIFGNLRKEKAEERVVDVREVVRRKPEVIFVSWCGKRFKREKLMEREGWKDIPAVKEGRIFRVEPEYILQPNHKVLIGIKKIQRVLMEVSHACC